MKLHNTTCPLCGSDDNQTVIYQSNINFSDITPSMFSARRKPDRIHYTLVRCQNDGMVRSNPVLPIKTLYSLYTRSTFTYQAETENLAITYMHALKPILSNLSKKSAILEIGCGNGFMLEALIQSGFTNVYGVEPSRDAVKKAKQSIQHRILIDVLRSNSYRRKFDALFFFQTLDHIPDPNSFLKICYSLLKSGGYIMSFNHNIESITARILGEKSPIIDIEHTVLYSPSTIRMLFKKNGFKVQSVTTPLNLISLAHLAWLAPIPSRIKQVLLRLSRVRLWLPLGNVCIIAQK